MKVSKKKLCPVCKSKFVRSKLKSGKYIYNTCPTCDLLTLRPTKITSEIYTDEYYYRSSSVWYSKYGDILTKYANYLKWQLIYRYLVVKQKKAKLLDVGCGDCSFLTSSPNPSVDLYGIDLNPRSPIKKLKLYSGDFLKKKFDTKFDAITLWHVIEHLDDPTKLLTKIHKDLNASGLFIVSTPNTNSLGFRHGKQRWFHFDAPFHTTLYDNNNLRMILKRSGYTIIKEKSFFFEFPTDLLKSLTGIKRWIVLPVYPLVKLFDRETVIFICKKT